MKQRQWDRLLVKLIGIILINALIATIVFLMIAYPIGLYYMRNETRLDPQTSNLIFLSVTFLAILVFIIGFSIMMRKTLRKITYLSSEIEQIANGDLGRTVKVEGRDELASLGESVNQMSKQLRELFEKERAHEEERNQLFSNLSHDLRTPLTSIKGYSQLLQLNRELTSEEKDHFRILNEKTDQLEHLLDQLMDVNRLYAPHMQLKKQKLNLSLLTTQLIHEMEPLFNERDLHLQISIKPDVWIEADQEQLIRVFENLFSNTWKYAEQTSPIHVELQTQAQTIEWSISNATTVETIEAIPHLFDRTYRVDSSRGVTPGDGLGLSIARQIILLHGGKLTAEPIDDQIICFRASFPIPQRIERE